MCAVAAATANSAAASSARRAASRAVASASSTRTSMSAHLCLTAWKEPMGRPNWNRVQIVAATGYGNVLWGDDYPHLEGTYGHIQETLRGLFAGVSDEVRERVTSGTFNELFQVPAQTPAQASV